MSDPGIFGEDALPLNVPREIILQRWVRVAGYRWAEMGEIRRCKNCGNHIISNKANPYHKCLRLGISGGPGTDIRLKKTCIFWEEGEWSKKVYFF